MILIRRELGPQHTHAAVYDDPFTDEDVHLWDLPERVVRCAACPAELPELHQVHFVAYPLIMCFQCSMILLHLQAPDRKRAFMFRWICSGACETWSSWTTSLANRRRSTGTEQDSIATPAGMEFRAGRNTNIPKCQTSSRHECRIPFEAGFGVAEMF